MYDFVAYRSSNELCWNADEKGGEIQVCVAGWRVPMPPPGRIRVTLYENGEHSLLGEAAEGRKEAPGMPPQQKRLNIMVRMRRKPHGGDRVRFDPEGLSSQWPAGSLFVPKTLLDEPGVREVCLSIEWMDLPGSKRAAEIVGEAVGAAG